MSPHPINIHVNIPTCYPINIQVHIPLCLPINIHVHIPLYLPINIQVHIPLSHPIILWCDAKNAPTLDTSSFPLFFLKRFEIELKQVHTI